MEVDVYITELCDSVTLAWKSDYRLPQAGDLITLGGWLDGESEERTRKMPASLLYDRDGWENDTLYNYLSGKTLRITDREWYLDEDTKEQICLLTAVCHYE